MTRGVQTPGVVIAGWGHTPFGKHENGPDVSLSDLSFVEVHDCFTIAELNLYEVLGITAVGEGASAIESGLVLPSGELPVNVWGGLKSKGHPVGATGVSQIVLAGMQLTGTAGDLQLSQVDRAAVHNMGGLAVANYVSVLETRMS